MQIGRASGRSIFESVEGTESSCRARFGGTQDKARKSHLMSKHSHPQPSSNNPTHHSQRMQNELRYSSSFRPSYKLVVTK
jgi:hypothetical protein